MTGGIGIWGGGLVGSVLANAAILGVLSVAMRPEPVEQQQSPQSELDVQAYQLQRDRANESNPTPEAATSAKADSTRMDAGQISQSKATAGSPNPIGLAARSTPSQPLASAQTLTPPQRPSKVDQIKVSSTTTATPPIVGGRAASQQVVASSFNAPDIDHVEVGGTTLPPVGLTAPDVEASQMAALPLATTAGKADLLNAFVIAGKKVNSAPNDALKMTAALAFSGEGDGNVDPASLAAFQSFVRPGDALAQGDAVRDAVAGVLAQVPCSRLQVEFDPTTSTLVVKGHVPEDALRGPVLSALQTQMGKQIRLADNMLILPRPQCGALSGISDVGLPQSTDQITNPLLIGADTHVRELAFVKNDRLYFDLTAPDYDAYIYVDYFDADGNVLHLAPNEQVPGKIIAAKEAIRVGASTPDGDGLQIFIGPPYGQEIAAAFAASAQLYTEVRPLVEPAAGYLEWLKSKVITARDSDPEFKGEWVYFFVRTSKD